MLGPRSAGTLLATAACASLTYALPVWADADASAFAFAIKRNAQLLPTLYAREVVADPSVGREYDYTTRGFFKVAGRTVGQLPRLTGNADGSGEVLRLQLSRALRSDIRAAARRRGAQRVVLTFVHQIVLTSTVEGDQAPRTQRVTQEVILRIPRR